MSTIEWPYQYPTIPATTYPQLGTITTLPTTAQQGWQCPICKSVYAPSVRRCFSTHGTTTITGSPLTSGTAIPLAAPPVLCGVTINVRSTEEQ